MSQRRLLAAGVVSMAAAIVLVSVGLATSGGTPMGGYPMMGWFNSLAGRSISIDQAQQSVQSFLGRTGDQDLKIDELMEFDRNFYALIQEKSTGIGAFELLVDKAGGSVGAEPGPNMMWNTKYSMMGSGMMGGGLIAGGGTFRINQTQGSMTVSEERATQIAQKWLDLGYPGDSAGEPDAFYGYYTFHFENSSHIAGMLSVNGYTGEVWFHSWHGNFVQVRDFGA